MDTVAILDTETTALDPEDGQCIEVAVVRYSIAHRCVVDSFSRLIRAESNAAEAINHIPAGVLAKQWTPKHVWALAEFMCINSDAVLAHNADFDRQWVPPEYAGLLAMPWIDTCQAVDWPQQSKPGSSLINLCLEHGIGVVDPHRALSDCLMLAALLKRCAEFGHDVGSILARGLRERAWFEALVPIERKDEAKDLGFGWMNKGFERKWTRKMAVEDVDELPFAVEMIG